ncbi:MAG: sulfatase-like hydrolase/transferase [Saprospiraceae bacterium]|nr:sulfatase-like hydrolase/transferase [Saprospiraceae bacterium]
MHISSLIFTGLMVLLALVNSDSVASDKRPNFIFIFCDDLGWADLPAHGHQSVTAHGGWLVRGELKMPNVDRMAAEGTIFSQFYVNAGVCSPSRAGMMTGQFPGSLGIHDYLGNPKQNKAHGIPDWVEPSIPMVTSLLQDAGYKTAHFGKWHLGSGPHAPKPEEYGIDQFKPCNDGPMKRVGSTEMIADETINFLESSIAGKEPFYINAWLYDPHSPLRPTEEMMDPYKHLSPRFGDNKGALEIWYGVLSDIDKHVGRILDKLDELGLSEKTVVVFSSDNGPESGLIPFVSHYGGASSTSTGPFRGVKRSLYEGGIREPFIVRWLGTTPAGKVDNASVISGVDWLPTVCDLAGVKLPRGKKLDGENLSPAFKGIPVTKTKPQMWENRFPVYGHVIHKSPMLAIRVDNWKLLMNPDRSRVELYDIPNDPTELNNLASRKPDIVKDLSEKVLTWQATLPEGPVDPNAGSNAYPWPQNQH